MKRQDIDIKYKWNTEDIFSSLTEFDKTLSALYKKADFFKYKGKLNNAKDIKNCLDEYYEFYGEFERLCLYAYMTKDENVGDKKGIELVNNVEDLSLLFDEKTSFIMPELSMLDKDTLINLSKEGSLKDYNLLFLEIAEQKPHILDEKCEEILAKSGKVLGGYHDIFSIIDNVDLDFPTIKVGDKRVKVTHAKYSELLQNKDKNVRKKAFKSYYKAYEKVLNTITAIYKGNLDKDVFVTKVRNFNSCLERALFNEKVDKKVYDSLLKFTHNALPILHRYVKDRKEILNTNINMYDMYVPLIKGQELALDYEDAFNLVKEGLKPLGKDYLNLLQRSHDERWIDVYENDGKRSGAYSTSAYNVSHPYVLLNHNKTTHSVFTIAHELGHAIHSFKSDRALPITKAGYKIFVAEVASTVNEVLLLKYLIKNAKSNDAKKYYLSYYLDMIRTTLFRQTMFAEFEYLAHDLCEKGQAITKETLNALYLKLNKKYYGKHVTSDKEISYEWSRIPHFYTAFYVYKYATGIISAIAISEKILSEGQTAVDDYFKFLSSGGSDKPTELLKITGVDLENEETYRLAFKSFEDALIEFENIK